jgi:hypothetical protein
LNAGVVYSRLRSDLWDQNTYPLADTPNKKHKKIMITITSVPLMELSSTLSYAQFAKEMV